MNFINMYTFKLPEISLCPFPANSPTPEATTDLIVVTRLVGPALDFYRNEVL